MIVPRLCAHSCAFERFSGSFFSIAANDLDRVFQQISRVPVNELGKSQDCYIYGARLRAGAHLVSNAPDCVGLDGCPVSVVGAGVRTVVEYSPRIRSFTGSSNSFPPR